MKNRLRKATLMLFCMAAAVSAASCSMSQTYPLTVDGEKIRAGIYILEQSDALGDAESKLTEEQPDLDTTAEDFDYLKQTVEGIAFADWVNNKAVERCREYMAVERLFAENGLSLTADEVQSINDNVNSLWTEENTYAQYIFGVDIVGDYYASIGIGEQSYKDYRLNVAKNNTLFSYYYSEGGPEALSESEKNDYITEHYAAANYFEYTLETGDGAQSYADRINGGESYESVYSEYDLSKRRADTQAQIDAAAESGEEYDGEPLDSLTAEEFEQDSLVQIIEKDSTSPSEEFVKQVFEMNAGETKVISVTEGEGDSAVTKEYVVSKLDALSNPEYTESYTDTILHELKDDAFEAKLKEKADSLSVVEDSSKALFKVDKLIRK